MSQELQVVQCYSCQTFQTQIAKKANKWICKICNEKQSLKKVYGQGKGKDCREHCRKLNNLREKREHQENVLSYEQDAYLETSEPIGKNSMMNQPVSSKWAKYLSPPSNSDEEESDAEDVSLSQLCIPKCTPEAFEIPSAKKYKSDQAASTELCIDSDDDCFYQVPDEHEILKRIESSNSGDNVTINIPAKTNTSLHNIPSTNFNLIGNDFMDADIDDFQPENPIQNVSPQISIENTNGKLPINSSSFQRSDNKAGSQVKNKDHAVFKIAPSKHFAIEQFKKRISLLEDLDNYTIDELTQLCTL